MPAQTDLHVHDAVIVGTGFGGMGAAIALRRLGIEDIVMLDREDDLGGTWHVNRYPGLAVDIPSANYSYSFEPNPSWSRVYSPQAEILAYLRHCARKYGLLPHIRFGAQVVGADWDEARGVWTVHLAGGEALEARALVLGNGALHLPAYPDVPGHTRFEGPALHSACWDHGLPLEGKRVAVIGTGASAVQLVPQLAPRAARLHVFQRTPPWVLPRPDRAVSAAERAAFARWPALQRAWRAALYWRLESQVLGFTVEPRLMRLGEWMARRHLRASVSDPALRAALTPAYRMGCKRVLLSSDYYPALTRPHVELVTTPIESIGPRGVRTRDGREREVDVLVYGTGFRVAEYLTPIRIRGAGGQELAARWREAPETYLGITVSGFPNLFLLMGPNTGLGHNSMVFMIEAQAHYAAQCLRALRERGVRSMDVRADVQASFSAALQRRLGRTVWATGCRSWYQAGDGRNVALWPGSTWDYWRRTRRVRLADYVLR
jgi:cation diffusion facilitator CzcD-associated flavoprotein CzcO